MVELRKTLRLPLDDLLAVVREFITPNVSRSGLDRCLRRRGLGSLEAMQPKAEKLGHKPFKSYEPGFVHLDVKYLPQMPDEDRRRYLFVAIDRATRWGLNAIYPEKTAANARRFLRSLLEAAPFRLRTILTDNGKEFDCATTRTAGCRVGPLRRPPGGGEALRATPFTPPHPGSEKRTVYVLRNRTALFVDNSTGDTAAA